MNVRTNIAKLHKDGHDYELDEASLASCDIGCVPVAHHADFEPLRLLHVSLVEELVEKQVGPLDT